MEIWWRHVVMAINVGRLIAFASMNSTKNNVLDFHCCGITWISGMQALYPSESAVLTYRYASESAPRAAFAAAELQKLVCAMGASKCILRNKKLLQNERVNYRMRWGFDYVGTGILMRMVPKIISTGQYAQQTDTILVHVTTFSYKYNVLSDAKFLCARIFHNEDCCHNAMTLLKLLFPLDPKGPVTTSHDKCAFVDSQQRLVNICADWTVSQLYTNTDVPTMASASWHDQSHLEQLCTAHDELSQSHRLRDTLSPRHTHRTTVELETLSSTPRVSAWRAQLVITISCHSWSRNLVFQFVSDSRFVQVVIATRELRIHLTWSSLMVAMCRKNCTSFPQKLRVFNIISCHSWSPEYHERIHVLSFTWSMSSARMLLGLVQLCCFATSGSLVTFPSVGRCE